MKEIHTFSYKDINFLFKVHTLEICRINTLARDVLNVCRKTEFRDLVIHQLKKKYDISSIVQAIEDLKLAGIFFRDGEEQQPSFKPMQFEIESPIIGQIILSVVQDCNLACKYCLANHGIFFDKTGRMSFEVAKAAVDFLIRESREKKSIRIIFLGGEPFLNFPLIKKIVIYAKKQAGKFSKKVKFTTSTNGTLLNNTMIDFLIKNDFTMSVSIDGPPNVHDDNRIFKSGAGSYYRILPKVKQFLSIAPYKIIAAATLTPSHLDFVNILEHLYNIGFKLIRFAPALPSAACEYQEHIFYGDNIAQYKTAFTNLIDHEIHYFIEKKEIRLLNLFDVLRDFHLKRRTAFACGMGRFFLGIASNGDLYPCNLFTGLKEYKMGNVFVEFDHNQQLKYVDKIIKIRKQCNLCWARYICRGGCLALDVLSNHKPEIRNEFCRSRLESFEVGIWAYTKMKELDTINIFSQMTESFLKESAWQNENLMQA